VADYYLDSSALVKRYLVSADGDLNAAAKSEGVSVENPEAHA